MIIPTKPIDAVLLGQELTAANVAHTGLSITDLGTELEILTGGEDGELIDLPPEAEPVVDAHVAPPQVVEHVETRVVTAVTRTTDAAFHEIWRLPTTFKHIYRAALEMRATDATDGTTKAQEARLVFKGLASSVVQVGTTSALWAAQDAAASAWAIQAQVQGIDLVFGVRGAAGKTIDWSLEGQIVIFAPEGLT